MRKILLKKRFKRYWKNFFNDLKEALDELDREYKVTMTLYDLTHHDHYMYPSKKNFKELKVIDLN